MEWHINDLSLNGQFSTFAMLQSAIEPLLILRNESGIFRSQFYISATLYKQPATAECNLYEAIQNLIDPNFKKIATIWLSKGPFWDNERCFHENDYFEFDEIEVTDQGLGEATRRQINGTEVNSFSITGSNRNCEQTPLRIQHGLSGEIFGHYDICNIWDIPTLKAAIDTSRPEPRNWTEFLLNIQDRFNRELTIADTACDILSHTPFVPNVVRRSLELLQVLSRLVDCRDAQGAWTTEGQELINTHFHGDKAWFSDESEKNKRDFKSEMTFPDPEQPGRLIFCPMHGKIKTPQTRIHFEWPIADKKLKVLYIGPKITKV
jgi:hypothetical protein